MDLQTNQSLLNIVIDGTPDAIFVKDKEGRYVLVNTACASFIGMSKEEIIGKRDEDIYSPETAAQFNEHDREVLLSGETHVFEGTAVGRGGEYIYLVTKSVYRNEDGEIIGLIGISHDITARKKAEEHRIELVKEQEARRRAEETNRLMEDFLATLSHELRTPLTAILGWVRLLQTNSLREDQIKRALDVIERSAVVQNQLIEDLLDVSRIISGKLNIEVQDVDFAQVVETSADAMRLRAEAKQIEMRIDVEAGPQIVAGDFNRLQQVVWNLLVNAVKFTPEGGRIDVRLKPVDDHCELSVKDTGIGIKPEFLPRVFNRFQQGDHALHKEQGGLGLGLAIVRHIVESLNGTVTARSEGEGAGSEFTVRLPLKSPFPAVGSENRRSGLVETSRQLPETFVLKDKFVLVVDDDNSFCELVTTALGNCGATVYTASSAGEGLQVLNILIPDLLISDIGMPGEDGYSLIGKVRELDSECRDIPAIAVTAYAREDDRIKSLLAGFQMHLSKPINPLELVATVARLTV